MSSLVSQYYPSRFIRADALPQRRGVYTIEKVGEEEMRNDNGQVRKQLCLGLKELEGVLGLNKTNLAACERGLGSDTATWSGKQIVLRKDTTTFQNRVVECVRVEIPEN